jgi:hypothetical protein
MLGLIAAQQQATSPTGTASLKARVIAADSGSPVRRATIRVESKGFSWATTTDDDGRFLVPELPAGPYTIRVARQGYLTWLFGREPAGSMARVAPIEIRAGQVLDRGDLRLPRGGVIAGRIVDEFGDPVTGIDVRALRLNYLAPGEPRLDYVRHGSTNDLGEYRIFDLPPGRYFVGIGLSIQEAAERTTQGAPRIRIVASRRGVAPQFYPGTAIATEATPVTLEPGGTASGIDIRQLSVPLASVSGTVTNSRGAPAADAIVMLNPARADRILFSLLAFVEPQPDGRFHFANIPPGDYRIDVVPKARLEAIGQTGTTNVPRDAREEIASVPITVTGQDMDVAVRTARGYTVEGRLRVEGGSPTPPGYVVTVSAMAATRREGMSGAFFSGTGQVRPDGRFVMNGIASRVILGVHGLPQDWALKAVTVNGTDVTDAGLDVNTDVQSVDVLVTPTPSRLTVTMADTTGAVLSDAAAVVVFPSDSTRWTTVLTRYVRSARPSGSSAMITGLPAGDYLAAAVDILEPDWASPTQLEALRKTATPFTIADGEQKTVTLVRR